MFTRPATGHIAPSVVSVVLCGAPVFAEEHLVHAWDALRAALRASERDDRKKVAANITYARTKLSHAESAERVDPLKQELITAELVELRRAIADAERFF